LSLSSLILSAMVVLAGLSVGVAIYASLAVFNNPKCNFTPVIP
jgi:hypothetical protein